MHVDLNGCEDRAVKVLPSAAVPAKITVRWPDGKTTVSEISAGAREIFIDTEVRTNMRNVEIKQLGIRN